MPLADVTLVLLIMLMLLSPMALQSMIQIQAAQAVAASKQFHQMTEKPLFVNITSKGFTINNNPVVSEYDLFRRLQGNLLMKKDKTVLISSDRDVKYDNVVKVLDIVRQSGAQSLSLVPGKKDAA